MRWGPQTLGGGWALPPVPLSQQRDTFRGRHALHRIAGSAHSISFCLILCQSPGISREAGDEASGPEPLVNLTVRPRATHAPLTPVLRLRRARPRAERTLAHDPSARNQALCEMARDAPLTAPQSPPPRRKMNCVTASPTPQGRLCCWPPGMLCGAAVTAQGTRRPLIIVLCPGPPQEEQTRMAPANTAETLTWRPDVRARSSRLRAKEEDTGTRGPGAQPLGGNRPPEKVPSRERRSCATLSSVTAPPAAGQPRHMLSVADAQPQRLLGFGRGRPSRCRSPHFTAKDAGAFRALPMPHRHHLSPAPKPGPRPGTKPVRARAPLPPCLQPPTCFPVSWIYFFWRLRTNRITQDAAFSVRRRSLATKPRSANQSFPFPAEGLAGRADRALFMRSPPGGHRGGFASGHRE